LELEDTRPGFRHCNVRSLDNQNITELRVCKLLGSSAGERCILCVKEAGIASSARNVYAWAARKLRCIYLERKLLLPFATDVNASSQGLSATVGVERDISRVTEVRWRTGGRRVRLAWLRAITRKREVVADNLV
jgi:hypothetical protein